MQTQQDTIVLLAFRTAEGTGQQSQSEAHSVHSLHGYSLCADTPMMGFLYSTHIFKEIPFHKKKRGL